MVQHGPNTTRTAIERRRNRWRRMVKQIFVSTSITLTISAHTQPKPLCCDSLLIAGSGRTCNKDTGSEGDTLGG